MTKTSFKIGDLLIISSSRKVFGRHVNFFSYETPRKLFFARVGLTPLLVIDSYDKNKQVQFVLLLNKTKVITSLEWLNNNCELLSENKLTNKT